MTRPSTMSKLSNSALAAATSGRYQPRGGRGTPGPPFDDLSRKGRPSLPCPYFFVNNPLISKTCNSPKPRPRGRAVSALGSNTATYSRPVLPSHTAW